MSFVIRAFTTDDYEALATIYNNVFPEYPRSSQQIRFNDEKRDSKCHFGRYVAEVQDQLVGTGIFDQRIWSYHPQYFDIDVLVLPEFQNHGIGTALYERVLNELAPFNPIKLNALYREDYKASGKFLTERGYREDMRAWESRLDVPSFDFAPYHELIDKVESSGIRLAALAEIPQSEARDRTLHELENDLGGDVPSPDPFTPIEYEFFVERTLKNPDLFPEAYYLALDGESIIGQSALWKSQGNRDLYTGLTGVKRAYRRRNIALALKIKTIEVARQLDYPLIKTWNASTNEGMLSINNRLGYVRQPAWISCAKRLDLED